MSSSPAGRGRRWWLIRSADIGYLQDAFLVSAVTMIIVIRFQLWATNYPQLGSGKLHVAHLLWGGLFMMIALLMLVSFVGHRLRLPAAIVGGIGFGFFIDELGKFITEDNDYFYEPAAGIIYLIFVVLYLVTRWMQRNRELGGREALVNAADMISGAAERGFDTRQKRRVLELLSRAPPDDPLTGRLTGLVRELPTVAPREVGALERLAAGIHERYARLVETRSFNLVLTAIFGWWAFVAFVAIVMLGLAEALSLAGVSGIEITGPGGDEDLSFIDLAAMASAMVSGVLVISGVLRLRSGDRLAAYIQFDRALMVAILIGGFFSFVEIQFSAVTGLLFNLLLLITIRIMISGEEELRRSGSAPSEPVADPPAVAPPPTPA
ncbi:MAG: hypothetical protein ACRDL6_08765 [Solirubrobacterales bacterium]